MNQIKRLISIFIISLLTACHAEEINSPPNNQRLEKTKDGVTFSLKQLSPDQVNAFYIGRGFTIEQIKPYTKTCVYTATLRNDKAQGRIHFMRDQWRVIHDGKNDAIKANAEWLSLFKQQDVKPSALIAFRLAQLPEEQEYEPNGDWNQGMLSINLPIGSTFNITVNWDINGKPYHLKMQEIHCANLSSD